MTIVWYSPVTAVTEHGDDDEGLLDQVGDFIEEVLGEDITPPTVEDPWSLQAPDHVRATTGDSVVVEPDSGSDDEV